MSGFPPGLFEGRRYVVVGLGRNGMPALRALAAMGAGVVGWDDAAFAREAAAAEGFDVRDPEPDIAEFDAMLLSPGIAHRLPVPHRLAVAARAARLPILSDADMLYQAVRGAGLATRFAGVTGTNGKSTTTVLLAHLLRGAGIPVAAGGNLGPAALALPALPEDGVYVLEMSSYMLERLATLRFDVAAMLNLSPDHLDRHGDMAAYAGVKRTVFARQAAGDVAVCGIDDAPSRAMAAGLAGCVRISGEHPADVWCEGGMLRDAGGPLLAMRDAPALPGVHNAQNAAAATAMALALGVPRDTIATRIASFAGLPHRQELVGTVDGVAYINDSKATNAEAASRAVACYPRVVWIAGGIAKSGGIAAMAPLFPRIAEALLIGRDAALFGRTLAEHGVAVREIGTLDGAVPAARLAAAAHGAPVVLLSPACASFDQFTSFEARGDLFRALVAALR